MTGEPLQLIRPCVEAVQDMYKAPMREALEFLIDNQFVQVPNCEHRAWKVLRGSEIGLPHSGEVADIVFLMNERKFILRQENATEYNIKAIINYRDDMMLMIDIAGNNVPKVRYILKQSKFFC